MVGTKTGQSRPWRSYSASFNPIQPNVSNSHSEGSMPPIQGPFRNILSVSSWRYSNGLFVCVLSQINARNVWFGSISVLILVSSFGGVNSNCSFLEDIKKMNWVRSSLIVVDPKCTSNSHVLGGSRSKPFLFSSFLQKFCAWIRRRTSSYHFKTRLENYKLNFLVEHKKRPDLSCRVEPKPHVSAAGKKIQPIIIHCNHMIGYM